MTGAETVPARPRTECPVVSGIVALLGIPAPLVTMFVSAGIARHDMIAETIGDLGRGPQKWLTGTGFHRNAGGFPALAAAAAHLHPGRWGWPPGVRALAALALPSRMTGLRDACHTEAHTPPGRTVQTWPAFVLAPLGLAVRS